MRTLRVLVIGGYGTFGGRLVRLLSSEPGLHLLVAGRSRHRAASFVARVDGAATLEAIALDRNGDLAAAFAEHRPDVVVDASGPFQGYGEGPYRVVEAALAGNCHYLDLADDRQFVLGIRKYNRAASEAGLVMLSGLSSCPALTAAVYRRITRDFSSVDSVSGGIAPSPYSGVGPNVVRAIASYAGKPVALRQEGASRRGYPFTETRRRTIGPPGVLPLRSLTFSLVDVPDLELLANLKPQAANTWFGAAPVPTIYHACFRVLARFVKRGWLKSLAPLAPLMSFVMNRFSWGEHRGGLFLECHGRDAEGLRLQRSWHLLAEGSVGPLTPTLACVAIIQRLLAGAAPPVGARPAHLDLELEDFEPLFAELGVQTGERNGAPGAGTPVFQQVLGDAWSDLPPAIAAAHNFQTVLELKGRANVVRGRSLIARAVAAAFRFPLAGEHVPVSVSMSRSGDREVWRREFDGRQFSSTLSAGHGAWDSLICETFGLIRFGMAPVIDGQRLRLVMRRWSIAGIPMPMFLLPRGETYESVRNGRFCFDVDIRFPFLGHIVTYRGWLEPAASSCRAD